MTTTPKPEYVTSLDHEEDCARKDDRSALYLYREVAEFSEAFFFSDGEREYIDGTGKWEFDDDLRPMRLRCDTCDASRYVVIEDDVVIAITRENCPRWIRSMNYHAGVWKTPCEYCGFGEKKE